LQLAILFNVMDDDVRGLLKKLVDIGFSKEIESVSLVRRRSIARNLREFAALVKDLACHGNLLSCASVSFKKCPCSVKMPSTIWMVSQWLIPPMHNLRDNMQS